MNLTDTTLAYIAGLFDGEGCITIWKSKGPIYKWSRSPVYRLVIAVASTHRDTTLWLKSLFGGVVCRRSIAKNHPNCANAWKWTATDARAYVVLQQLKPFLRLKAPEATIGIDFQESRTANYKPGTALTKEEMERRDTMITELHKAKFAYKDYSLG